MYVNRNLTISSCFIYIFAFIMILTDTKVIQLIIRKKIIKNSLKFFDSRRRTYHPKVNLFGIRITLSVNCKFKTRVKE